MHQIVFRNPIFEVKLVPMRRIVTLIREAGKQNTRIALGDLLTMLVPIDRSIVLAQLLVRFAIAG